jgi:hypothetical protein
MTWEGKSMTREERKYTDTLHRLGPDRPFRMEEEWGPNDTATRTAARKDARRIGFYLVSLWDESGRLVFTRDLAALQHHLARMESSRWRAGAGQPEAKTITELRALIAEVEASD